MEIPIYIILVGTGILLASAALQGLTGFGFSLLAVPTLSLFLSPKTVVPIMLLFSIVVNLVVLYSCRHYISLKSIWPLFIGGTLGLPFGTYLLVVLDEQVLRLIIGVVILTAGLIFFMGFRKAFKRDKLAMIPIGFISGLLNGSVTMSGPPVILFLTNQGVTKMVFRANLVSYFLTINLITLPIFYAGGLFTTEVWTYSGLFFPGLLVGVFLGNWAASHIQEEWFRKLTMIIMVVMGLLAITTSGLLFG